MGPKLLHEFRSASGTKKLRFCDSFNSTCWPVAFRQSTRFWRPDELWWAAAIHQPTGLSRAAICESTKLWWAAIHQPTGLLRAAICESTKLWWAAAIHQPIGLSRAAICESTKLWWAAAIHQPTRLRRV